MNGEVHGVRAARLVDLARVDYAAGFEHQLKHHGEVLAARERGEPEIGRVLLLEHDPAVITVSQRASAAANLVATPELLARMGVTVANTDRGGDITYHGPGQIIAYPIVDLNLLNIGLHEYMRLLEQAVIDTLGHFGVKGERDSAATGVWVRATPGGPLAKIAAMGVRVRRWVSMHGLSLNVNPDMRHYGLIVPCGLAGRPVTSLAELMGSKAPTVQAVKARIGQDLARLLGETARVAEKARTSAAT